MKMPVKPKVVPSKFTTGRRTVERKKKPRKPQWNDTVHDLNVHKASPDEMARRKQVAKSANLELVRSEKFKKQIAQANTSAKKSETNKKFHHAFLREILHNQNEITEALAHSDEVMTVVKGIFGDDPKKFRGLPNITSAPGGLSYIESLPDGTVLAAPTKLDLLSNSVMHHSALNQLDDEYDSVSDSASDVGSYKAVLDVGRFERLLQLAGKDHEDETEKRGKSHLSHSMAEVALEKTLDKITDKCKDSDWLTNEGTILDSPVPNIDTGGAMNDTGKVNKTKARTTQVVIPPTPSTQDLHKVMEQLVKTLAEYECQTGRHTAASEKKNKWRPEQTFSCYTTTLITSVSKLLQYFQQSELRLGMEVTAREQLAQNVAHFKTLLDALTTDIIETQEQHAKLQSEFQQHKRDSDLQIHTLKQSLLAKGIEVAPVMPLPQPAFAVPLSSDGVNQLSNRSTPVARQVGVNAAVQHSDIRQSRTHIQTAGDPMVPRYSQGSRQQQHLAQDSVQHRKPEDCQRYLGPQTQSTALGLPRPQISANHSGPQSIAAALLSPPKQTDSPRTLYQKASLTDPTGLLDPSTKHIIVEEPSVPELPANAQLPMQASIQNAMQNLIQRQQRANHFTKPIGTEYMDMSTLQRQLAELNRQHEDAQDKLKDILQQQNLSNEQEQVVTHGRVSTKAATLTPTMMRPTEHRQSVSPPISPITVESDRSAFSNYNSKPISAPSRVITVAVPRVEMASMSPSWNPHVMHPNPPLT